MDHREIIPHLFRTEFGRITSVLSKVLGIAHLEIAEDIVSETFIAALEIWPYEGIPEYPTAWLYRVAKNKAYNYIHRNQIFTDKIIPQIKVSVSSYEEIDLDLSDGNIRDSQLKMLFAICHPSLSLEAQIALALRILCGFGIDEIAGALLSNKETINKRLYRAKEKLRQENIQIEFPDDEEINSRLGTVLLTLYLLFNEGYYSESHDSIMREDLCLEAMRLTYLLLENEKTAQPEVNALLSLMCFHASRFEARRNEQGDMILYQQQNEARWNQNLISRGVSFLRQSAKGSQLSKYHLEASIAYWHTQKVDTNEKWENILDLYNLLLQIEYSPLAALNRTFALAKTDGREVAIAEAEKLQLTDNHFYYTLLGELYLDLDNEQSKSNFEKALSLAKTKTDQQLIRSKLDRL